MDQEEAYGLCSRWYREEMEKFGISVSAEIHGLKLMKLFAENYLDLICQYPQLDAGRRQDSEAVPRHFNDCLRIMIHQDHWSPVLFVMGLHGWTPCEDGTTAGRSEPGEEQCKSGFTRWPEIGVMELSRRVKRFQKDWMQYALRRQRIWMDKRNGFFY